MNGARPSIFTRAVEAEILRHPGKWVACSRETIYAIGDNLEEVITIARAAGQHSPILWHVPDPAVGLFYESAKTGNVDGDDSGIDPG